MNRRKKEVSAAKRMGKDRTCNIVDNDCNRGIPDIAWNETPKPFLSSSIPVIHFKIWCFKHGNELSTNKTFPERHKCTFYCILGNI